MITVGYHKAKTGAQYLTTLNILSYYFLLYLNQIVYSLILEDDLQAASEDPIPMEQSLEITQENLAPEEVTEVNPRQLTPVPELDPDILLALGEAVKDAPKFGEKIHQNLARLWLPILRKGIEKEAKEKLMAQYQVSENCTLLQAPKLNPEIAATISDTTKNKDKRVEYTQQQLGLGITAVSKGLSLLLDNDSEKVKAVKLLSDGCRILCDLHHVKTEVRKKFMTPSLDRTFLSLMQDVDRDETLYGQNLSDKIKASRVIKKHGLQIKKPIPVKALVPSIQPTTSRHGAGNWSGPSRYTSNRGGGRQNYKKAGPVVRKGHQAATMKPSSSPRLQQNQNKPRAPGPVQRR
jgi:hypothetical protein